MIKNILHYLACRHFEQNQLNYLDRPQAKHAVRQTMSKREVDLADLGLDEPLDVASEIEARRILDQAAADTAAKAAAEERRLQLIAEQELNAQIAADMVRYKA